MSHQSSQQNRILIQNYTKTQICTVYMIWDYLKTTTTTTTKTNPKVLWRDVVSQPWGCWSSCLFATDRAAFLGPVSWRPTTVKWRQFSQSNRHSTIVTRQTEHHEGLPSSANDEVRCDSTFTDDGNASWYSVCRVPMVEWRLDCENCRHMTVVGSVIQPPWCCASGDTDDCHRTVICKDLKRLAHIFKYVWVKLSSFDNTPLSTLFLRDSSSKTRK